MGLQKMLALKQEFLLGQLRCWQQSFQKNLLEQQCPKNKRQTNKGFRVSVSTEGLFC